MQTTDTTKNLQLVSCALPSQSGYNPASNPGIAALLLAATNPTTPAAATKPYEQA